MKRYLKEGRVKSGSIETYLELVDGREITVTVKYSAYPSEPATREYPGSSGEIEITSIKETGTKQEIEDSEIENYNKAIERIEGEISDRVEHEGPDSDDLYDMWKDRKFDESKKNKMKNNKEIKALKEKIEIITGKKVIFLEKKEEEKVDAPKERIIDTNSPTLGNIVPDSSIKAMESYLDTVLADIAAEVESLTAIKKDITKGATAGGEDYYAKIEKLCFNIKQVARVAQYCNNTIVANKFDKELLDKILNNKQD
jgi:hypothetical protein